MRLWRVMRRDSPRSASATSAESLRFNSCTETRFIKENGTIVLAGLRAILVCAASGAGGAPEARVGGREMKTEAMPRRAASAPSSGKTSTVVLIVVGAVVVIVVGLGLLVMWGLDVVAEQVKADIQDNPVILEHIGRIESIDFEFMATGAAQGEDTLVFNLKGTKGEGVVTAEVITVDDEHEEVRSGTLRLPSGEKVDLFPEADPAPEPR